MDIKQFALLEDLNKTGSITSSAQRLGSTQSGISHTIKKLEKEWHIKLLKRTNHGVELTSEAKYLLPYMQSTLVQYTRFKEALDAIDRIDNDWFVFKYCETLVTNPFAAIQSNLSPNSNSCA